MDPKKLFKKTLTKTDVSKRMSFPTKKLNHLYPFQNGLRGVDLLIEDDQTGQVYPVRCTSRQQGHKKPVFSTGWTKVVRDLGLEAADGVTFFKLGARHLKFQVKKANDRAEEKITNEVGQLPADHDRHEREKNNATLDPGNNDRREVKNEINDEDGKAFKEPIKVFGADIGYVPNRRRPVTLFGVIIGGAST